MDNENTENCPECGLIYFHAIPGKTTKEQIIAFLKSIGEDVSNPFLHPGAYCPSGCNTGYLATYPSDIPCGETDQKYELILEQPVESDNKIILYLKRKLGWSLSDGRERIRRDSYPVSICDGALWQLQDMRDELVALDAKVSISNEPENSTFEQTINNIIDNRYPKAKISH